MTSYAHVQLWVHSKEISENMLKTIYEKSKRKGMKMISEREEYGGCRSQIWIDKQGNLYHVRRCTGQIDTDTGQI